MNEIKEAINYANKGDFKSAIRILESLNKIHPEDTDILYNLGMCYTEMGDPQKVLSGGTPTIPQDSRLFY